MTRRDSFSVGTATATRPPRDPVSPTAVFPLPILPEAEVARNPRTCDEAPRSSRKCGTNASEGTPNRPLDSLACFAHMR